MSPSAEPSPTTAEQSLVSADVLDDGELVILAIKPSGWFVLLVSWPVLVAAAAVVVGTQFIGSQPTSSNWRDWVVAACVAAALIRLIAACFQWMGRLYVLTNRRIMCLCGMARAEVAAACPLKKIRRTELTAVRMERLLGLGNLLFDLADGPQDAIHWVHINRPADVQQTVEEALRRAR